MPAFFISAKPTFTTARIQVHKKSESIIIIDFLGVYTYRRIVRYWLKICEGSALRKGFALGG